MKKYKIAFWITTTIIFLFEGVLTSFTWNSEFSRQGIMHLGYPGYFIPLLTVFKIFGTLALIAPTVPNRIKEWAYAGLGIDFICAFVSIWATDGFSGMVILPVIFFILLAISYISREKINTGKLPCL